MKTTSKGKMAELRAELAAMIGGWQADGSYPPNHQRKNGLGEIVAEVVVHLDGYQSPHEPIVIGWRAAWPASGGARHTSAGLILTQSFGSVDAARQAATACADGALEKLMEESR